MAYSTIYSPNINQYQVNTQRYKEDYFTGADVKLYFSDILIDEVTGIQFSMQENVQPVYGYASYVWDKVVRGNRMVQGSFSINFKENYYLLGVLEKLNAKVARAEDKFGEKDSNAFQLDTFNKGFNIEQMIAADNKANFQKIANEFEDSLWGGKLESSNAYEQAWASSHESFQKNKTKGSYYQNKVQQPRISKSGFDIVITFGPYMKKTKCSFGKNAENDGATIITLEGVQITGVSHGATRDGNPLEEMYTFIARDMNTKLK